jgi:hypothetical protein
LDTHRVSQEKTQKNWTNRVVVARIDADGTDQCDKGGGNDVQAKFKVLVTSFHHHLSKDLFVYKRHLLLNEPLRVTKSSNRGCSLNCLGKVTNNW